MLEGGEKVGMSTNLDQLDGKECKVKGGVPFSARKQILGYERPCWLKTCLSPGDKGQATKQSNKSQESRGLWVARHRLTHFIEGALHFSLSSLGMVFLVLQVILLISNFPQSSSFP